MVAIGKAGPEELPAVLALLERNGLPPDGLSAHLATILVARDGEQIIGSAALEMYGPAALLRSVAVDRTQRGHGLGGELTGAALDLARRQGVRAVYLLTETAEDYFPRFGFHLIERAAVDPAIHRSVEWTSVCPVSSQVMRLDLTQ